MDDIYIVVDEEYESYDSIPAEAELNFEDE
jgi:hypothetical protein